MDYGQKVVICIPVYGQSYALGEEAIRITNFDSLRIKYDDRIVTEELDHAYGYYDPTNRLKQYIKRLTMTNGLLNYPSMVWPNPSFLKQEMIQSYVHSRGELECNQSKT